MIEVIAQAIRKFNDRQHETESTRKTFVPTGQNLWRPCKDEFNAHLDKLSDLPLYGGRKCKNAAHGLEVLILQPQTHVLLSMGSGAVVEVNEHREKCQ